MKDIICPFCNKKISTEGFEKEIRIELNKEYNAKHEEELNKLKKNIEKESISKLEEERKRIQEKNDIELQNLKNKMLEKEKELDAQKNEQERLNQQWKKDRELDFKEKEIKIRNEYFEKYDNQISEKEEMIAKLKEEEIKRNLREQELSFKLEQELKNRQQYEQEIRERLSLDFNKEALRREKEIKRRHEEEIEKNNIQNKMEMDRLAKQLENVQKKLSYGSEISQELQGEREEEFFKRKLSEWFPLDEISDVPKGMKGSDLVQLINGRASIISEKEKAIIYEIKNTKEFKNEWIVKLQEDLVNSNAEMAILVTNALPKTMEDNNETVKVHNDTNIIICKANSETLRGVSILARELISQISKINSIRRSDLKDKVFEIIQSAQFQNSLDIVIEYFKSFKDDLESMKKQFDKFYQKQTKRIEISDERINQIKNTVEVLLEGAWNKNAKYLVEGIENEEVGNDV